MKKLLRSTFGTLVVAAFLAMPPPAYARGGHGGGHGKHRGGHGGHGGGHAAAAHVKGGHHGFGIRGGRGHARHAGRAYYATRGGNWEAGEVTTAIRTMAIPAIVQAITDWAIATRTTAITVTAPVGTMIHITDIILTDTGTGLT